MTTLMTGQMPGARGQLLDDDVDLARDRALVERAQAGDRTAFDDLYQRYYRRLYRFCIRRLQDAHEAEDVAQEAFARAWRALPSFAGDRRFYPWLSVIASHLCTDVLRRRNRATPVAEFHQSNVASVEDGGEERVIAAVDSDLVAQAFLRLSDRHQRILNLREGSGWSYQMIADHEGVGITAIETLLWRARQALKREFTSLAGSDGRLAGIVGGLLSLAFLRRFLAGLGAAARKTATVATSGSPWATAAAVSSAAAVSAAVVVGAVAVNGPTTPQKAAPTVAIATPGGSDAPAGPDSAASAATPTATGGSGTSTPHGNAAAAGDSSGGDGATGGAAGSVEGVVGNLGTTVNGIASTVQNAGASGVSGAIANGLATTAGGLNATANGLGTAVNGLGSTLSSGTDALTAPVTGLLGSTGLPVVSNLPAATSTLSNAAGDVTNVVSSILQGVTGGLVSAGTESSGGTTAGGGTTDPSSSSSSTPLSTSCAVEATLGTVQSTIGSLLGGTGSSGSAGGCS